MAVNEKISKLVASQFPSFYKEEGENFLQFMEAYYAWMETSGQMTDGIRNLESYRDISTTTTDFIDYFTNTFLPSVPRSMLADKKLAVKYAKYFNESRGTFEAYKLLFRAVYGEDIQLSLPSEQILKVSDGDWIIDRYLTTPYNINNYSFIGKEIEGISSGATALVEDVIRRRIAKRDIQQILLSNVAGTFYDLENIKIKGSDGGTGHAPLVSAGISKITVSTGGARYQAGDVVDIISDKLGRYGKVIITGVEQLNGALTYTINQGGSGYRASNVSPGTTISIATGLGTGADFEVLNTDLANKFTLTMNTNKLNSETEFKTNAPTISYRGDSSWQMLTFANVVIGSPRYGFPEAVVSGVPDYHEFANSVLRIANTKAISVDDKLFGVSSFANAVVTHIISASDGDTTVDAKGYKNFTTSETVRVNAYLGDNIGTVTSFVGRTFGSHVLNIANTATIAIDDELVGSNSNSFAVVTKIINSTAGNTYVRVSANSTSNVTSAFGIGPLKHFDIGENIRKVGSATVVGTAVASTANVAVENAHARLIDSLKFQDFSIGTVSSLSRVNSGTGYRVPPAITVKDNDVASLNIKEYILKLHSDDINWGTGNSNFTTLSNSDKLVQDSTKAKAYVMGSDIPGSPIAVTQLANSTYETAVRVWREFDNAKEYANDVNVTLETYGGSFTQGGTTQDSRTLTNSGTARIVSVTDNGVIGNNARVVATVGSNGSVFALRTLDSGFNYVDGETVTLAATSRALAEEATGVITLQGVANSEGYYASAKGHISSKRGFIQDSDFYQEYSYEIISPVAINNYRDIALKLVHPAGEKLFGKYQLQSNAYLNVTSVSASKKRLKANGTISLTQNSFGITGTGTSLTGNYANSGEIIIEYAPRSFYTLILNKVSNTTSANVTVAWSNSSVSSANIYYTSTSDSANIYYQVG